MVHVKEGVLGYILTPSDPTVEEQARYMGDWLVLETMDASRVRPDAAPASKATFFCRHGIAMQHGRALLHLYFQCRS